MFCSSNEDETIFEFIKKQNPNKENQNFVVNIKETMKKYAEKYPNQVTENYRNQLMKDKEKDISWSHKYLGDKYKCRVDHTKKVNVFFQSTFELAKYTDDEYEKLALTVIDICKEAKVPFILHQRIDVARRINCKNIQLSVSQLADLKSYIDEFTLISVSCHSLEDVQYAISMGANQIVLGTIFETDCKKGLKGKGLEFVKEICDYCKKKWRCSCLCYRRN